MFNRLLKSFGRPANQEDNPVIHDGELQLAAAVLLFGILPVDYVVTADEGAALKKSLQTLFGFSEEKCHRMMARAAAVYGRDTSILAATTLLKHRTTEMFRYRLVAEAQLIMRADGVLHDNELELGQRMKNMLGLGDTSLEKSA
jgi:uncharacterized tellurite resistance protein B-like protein